MIDRYGVSHPAKMGTYQEKLKSVDNGHAPSVYNIINKLDGNLYGVYQMPTCKHVLDEIANQYDRFPHSSYRFPQYDYDY